MNAKAKHVKETEKDAPEQSDVGLIGLFFAAVLIADLSFALCYSLRKFDECFTQTDEKIHFDRISCSDIVKN
jgi:hypothetical protein